jgi:predicted transposase YdaD
LRAIASILPCVPILKGGGEASIVQRAVQLLRADIQLNQLEPLLAFFASFVLDTPIVQQIMRWDMTVLRESPWYQEILTEGEERGLQRGIEQGEKLATLRQLIRILQRRFGEIPPQLLARLEGENLERLETLMDKALTELTGDMAVSSVEEFLANS